MFFRVILANIIKFIIDNVFKDTDNPFPHNVNLNQFYTRLVLWGSSGTAIRVGEGLPFYLSFFPKICWYLRSGIAAP